MNDNIANRIPTFVWRLVFAAALVAVFLATRSRAAEPSCDYAFATIAPPSSPVVSWMFNRGRYTHDPETGARVAQYDQHVPVEPLPDQRLVTSGYSRTRTVLRGVDGSANAYYQVQNYGNDRGGMNAEWERFHDAWRGSTVAGGQFFGSPPFVGHPGFGYGYGAQPNYGFGQPGFRDHRGRSRHGFPPQQEFRHRGPNPRWLDPDAADGYPDGRRRTPDRSFFRPDAGMPQEPDDDNGGEE